MRRVRRHSCLPTACASARMSWPAVATSQRTIADSTLGSATRSMPVRWRYTGHPAFERPLNCRLRIASTQYLKVKALQARYVAKLHAVRTVPGIRSSDKPTGDKTMGNIARVLKYERLMMRAHSTYKMVAALLVVGALAMSGW